jgi:hypothetical protein
MRQRPRSRTYIIIRVWRPCPPQAGSPVRVRTATPPHTAHDCIEKEKIDANTSQWCSQQQHNLSERIALRSLDGSEYTCVTFEARRTTSRLLARHHRRGLGGLRRRRRPKMLLRPIISELPHRIILQAQLPERHQPLSI